MARLRGEGVAALLVALAGALLYVPTVGHGYLLDDLSIVAENPVFLLGHWREALLGPYWPDQLGQSLGASNWRPLASLSLLLDRELAPGAALPMHHGVNALLHGLLVLALFPLARRFAGLR